MGSDFPGKVGTRVVERAWLSRPRHDLLQIRCRLGLRPDKRIDVVITLIGKDKVLPGPQELVERLRQGNREANDWNAWWIAEALCLKTTVAYQLKNSEKVESR